MPVIDADIHSHHFFEINSTKRIYVFLYIAAGKVKCSFYLSQGHTSIKKTRCYIEIFISEYSWTLLTLKSAR